MAAVGCDAIFSVISPVLKLGNYRDSLQLDFGVMNCFHKQMFDRGVWFMGRGNFMLSAAHTDEDIEKTLEIAGDVIGRWSD
jgi:glutamate-1-semialdehyde aminotransferase